MNINVAIDNQVDIKHILVIIITDAITFLLTFRGIVCNKLSRVRKQIIGFKEKKKFLQGYNNPFEINTDLTNTMNQIIIVTDDKRFIKSIILP